VRSHIPSVGRLEISETSKDPVFAPFLFFFLVLRVLRFLWIHAFVIELLGSLLVNKLTPPPTVIESLLFPLDHNDQLFREAKKSWDEGGDQC
jgi:hypothetical protein